MLELYGDDSKAIIKLDPRSKMVVLLASSVASICSYSMPLLFAYGVMLCILLFLCGKQWLAVKSLAIFIFVMYFRYNIVSQSTNSMFTNTLVTGILTIFLFFFPVFVSFMLLVKTTRINQFLAAFQAMHIPTAIVIPLAVMIRFIPTVMEEWNGIRSAMAYRGISLEPAAIIRAPLRTIEYVLIPLLFSSMAVMEELAAAALARGMEGGRKRSSYELVKFRIQDWIVAIMFAAAAVFFILVNRSDAYLL